MNFIVAWIWNLIGPKVAIGLAIVVAGLLAYGTGYMRARASCQEASLRSELAAARADLEHAREAAEKASTLSKQLTQAERRNDELARKLTGSCILSPADSDRLRSIR
jgi:hypothetical protein